jgi:hypothetical protein
LGFGTIGDQDVRLGVATLGLILGPAFLCGALSRFDRPLTRGHFALGQATLGRRGRRLGWARRG